MDLISDTIIAERGKYMSFTYGFYNSLNGDRKYNSMQISSIFDGIIKDGIFASIGTCMVVTATTGNVVNVGIGRAWFNHTWSMNDAIMPITADLAEVLLDRIDAVILEVNNTESVRANSIKILKGTPSSSPVNPTLTNNEVLHQYPLAYIRRPAGSTAIVGSNITNMVGTTVTPFVTGILSVVTLDQILGQWRAELDEFVASEETDFTTWYNHMIATLQQKSDNLDTWTANEESAFIAWFNSIKGKLSTDAAGNLQNQLTKEQIERFLTVGLTDGNKTFSEDGTVITTVDSTGRTLIKTFTNSFLTSTSILKSAQNAEIARLVKVFSADGKTISSTITFV